MGLVRRTGELLSLSFFLLYGAAIAGVSYDDVAVIVNVNSATSRSIGSYFQSARSIPQINIIPVNVPEQEVIDDATFASMRTQIETYLSAHDLSAVINYLVTTKGVPLKVNREQGGGEPFSTSSASASVESELSLIAGANSASVGKAGRIVSPYYNAGRHFSSADFGIYLVTRLDGYTLDDVLDLIDRAHPGLAPAGAAVFVFDQDPAWNSTVPYLNSYMVDAATELRGKGKTVELNADSVYVTNASDVLGYTSWGSNDHYAKQFTEYAKPHNTWAPGALAETYVSTSGRSFASPPSYGQSLIADLVAEGVSGAKGYVYEPYSSAMAVSSILYKEYTDGYNLAESYYQSSVYLSWMDVIVGDPKVSIDGSSPNPLPVQLSSLTASSDASTGKVDIHWTTQSEIQNYGFYVQRRSTEQGEFTDIPGSFQAGAGNSLEVHEYLFEDVPPAAGSFAYRLRQVDLDGTMHYSEAVIVTVNSTTAVNVCSTNPQEYRLEQNYPNPCNPTTVISGQWPVTSVVRLMVYDLLGHQVAKLAEGAYPPGEHSFTFDAHGLASGTYFYRLEVAGKVFTKKMAIIK